jgi:hypothetical protein
MTRHFVSWLWLLSGLPIGLALIFLPPSARLACFVAFVALETGHSLSPVVLAWTHSGFRRQVIYFRPRKFILLPTLVFLATLTVGIAANTGYTSYIAGDSIRRVPTLDDWSNPFLLVVWFYSACNLYHFGMQNFGVIRLAGSRRSRWLDMAIGAGGTVAVYLALPRLFHEPWVFFLLTGVVSVNHWMVDIGLSSRVARYGRVYIVGVLSAGLVGFLWMVPTSSGMMIRMVPVIVCARLGLGFVHFLYSRWVWRLSDPQVRETIGRDLLPRSDELRTICATSSSKLKPA